MTMFDPFHWDFWGGVFSENTLDIAGIWRLVFSWRNQNPKKQSKPTTWHDNNLPIHKVVNLKFARNQFKKIKCGTFKHKRPQGESVTMACVSSKGWSLRPPETRGRLFRLASGVARTEWRCWKRVPKMSGSAVLGEKNGARSTAGDKILSDVIPSEQKRGLAD